MNCRLKTHTSVAMIWDGTHASAKEIHQTIGRNVEYGLYETLPPTPFLRLHYPQGSMCAAPGDYIVADHGGAARRMTRAQFGDAYEVIPEATTYTERTWETGLDADRLAKLAGVVPEPRASDIRYRWRPDDGAGWIALMRDTTGGNGVTRIDALGFIRRIGGDWSAWLPDGVKIRSCDDRLSAARTLCAHLRVTAPVLP